MNKRSRRPDDELQYTGSFQFSLGRPVLRIPGVRLGEAVPRLPALGEGEGLGEIARLGLCDGGEVMRGGAARLRSCLLYTSPSPRDRG